ncbi:MAG: hypothetical protein HY893_07785 [Deltaproteobacteria bacterium]|nr:hypothetical protein [Deltaproteobacteria bacterium]
MRIPFRILMLYIAFLSLGWGCAITIEKASVRKGDLKGTELKGDYAKGESPSGVNLAPVLAPVIGQPIKPLWGGPAKAGKGRYGQAYKPEVKDKEPGRGGKDKADKAAEAVEERYIPALLLKGLKTGVHLYSWLPGGG